MANKASKYTKIRAEKRLQAVASLVREDFYFNSEYSRVKNTISAMEEGRARQIDLYINQVLKGSWFLQYWYRWYFGIQAIEVGRYVALTLQGLMEGGLKYKTMRPGQHTIFDKIETGVIGPLLQLPGLYMDNFIVLVINAFAQTRVYPEPWYQAIEDSYHGMVRWLSWNKLKDSPRIKPTEGGYEITLDNTTVNAQTLSNAKDEYDNTYWWQFSKKRELRAKYPFNVQKFSRAWDYHWVKDARKHCRDILKGNDHGIRKIEMSINFMFNRDTRAELENPASRITDLVQSMLIQFRKTLQESALVFFGNGIKRQKAVIRNQEPLLPMAAKGYPRYQAIAEELIENYAQDITEMNDDLPRKQAEYQQAWEALRLDYKRMLNALSDMPDILPYFSKLYNICEAAWSDLNLLALQRMGLTEETAKRLELLKSRVLNVSELKPGTSWFRGGDNSRYSIWLKKHNEMRLEIEALNSELSGHVASEQLVAVKEALSKIHTEIQYAYHEFMDASSSEHFPEMALVPHSTAYSPNRSGNLEIPEQEREYSIRARSSCEILGIPVSATKAQVRIAYKKKSLIYHPDKFTHEDPSQVIRAKYQLNRIQAAYEFLFTQNGLNDFIRRGVIDLGFLCRDIECQREEWADMRKEMEEYLPIRDAYIKAQFEEIKREQQINRENLERWAIEQENLAARIAVLMVKADQMMNGARQRVAEQGIDIHSASTTALLTRDYSARVSPQSAQANVSKEIDPLTAEHAISSPVAK